MEVLDKQFKEKKMNDMLVISFFVYLTIGGVVMATLPDSFYSGTTIEGADTVEFKTLEVDGSESTLGQVSTISKVVKFLFLGWSINGIPAVLGGLISLINTLGVIIGVVWGYDKFRGI